MASSTRIQNVWALLRDTAVEFVEDNAPVYGAALAYYTLFSIAPLLIIAIALAGMFFGTEAARTEVANHLRSLLGTHGAGAVETILSRARSSGAGVTASAIGALTLLVGASRVFTSLQTSLNVMWDVSMETQESGFRANARKVAQKRIVSFAMVLAVGFLLLASLLASTFLNAAGPLLKDMTPAPAQMTLLWLLDLVASLGGVTVVLALIYRFLPDTRVAWRDVWFGATVTALMLAVGRTLIGWYLANSSIRSIFGAAGSLVVILVWVYYSAQIILFGAEMTQVFARRYGSKGGARGRGQAPRSGDAGR